MEPVACHCCGTPFSSKFDLLLSMYINVPDKTPELWNKVIDRLNIINSCCKMLSLSVMTRDQMIALSAGPYYNYEMDKLVEKYLRLYPETR